MSRRASLALAALAAILAVTAAWWLLALWPSGPAVPAWVERTRAACFGTSSSGLPHAGGWVLLVGEPLGMLGFLVVVWGRALREGLQVLARSHAGRGALALAVLLVAAGIGAATVRVREAAAATFDVRGSDAADVAGVATRLDRPTPPLALVDQHGDSVRLERFAGRPVVVVFAYAHCETVCPLVVHDAVRAIELAAQEDPALLVVTLDPWRDTPSRLPYIAESWKLPRGAHVLSGEVEAVERTLDAWGIARRRDERTGEIVHPTTAYLIDSQGRLAWASPSDPARLAALIARM